MDTGGNKPPHNKTRRGVNLAIMRVGRRREQPKFLSAGVAVVRREEDGWRLLILRAYRNWDFPKGGVEPGETPMQAALRETREESGVTDLDFVWGEDWRETVPYGKTHKVARYYLAQTRQVDITLPISPELGQPEHHEWRWVSPEEAQKMLPPRLQPILRWMRERLGE